MAECIFNTENLKNSLYIFISVVWSKERRYKIDENLIILSIQYHTYVLIKSKTARQNLKEKNFL